jgi:hypothetical protein
MLKSCRASGTGTTTAGDWHGSCFYTGHPHPNRHVPHHSPLTTRPDQPDAPPAPRNLRAEYVVHRVSDAWIAARISDAPRLRSELERQDRRVMRAICAGLGDDTAGPDRAALDGMWQMAC